MNKKLPLFIVSFVTCLCPLCAMTPQDTLAAAPSLQQPDSVTLSTGELADKIIEEAQRHLGVPYRLGARGPRAFDCSNFTSYVYRQFGFTLSGNAITQSTQGREVEGSISNLQKGDLVFFGSRRNVNKLGHVALYMGPDSTGDGFYFIHAAAHGGIKITNSKESYYKPRFLGARRILPDFYAPGDTTVSIPDILECENKVVVEICDTLTLENGDRRFILLSNGSWMNVDSLGNLSAPEINEKIILEPNGRWTSIRNSTHIVPSLTKPKAVKDSTSASAVSSDTEVLYHKIKYGDTLYDIARKYHTTINAICQLNGMKTNSILRPGKSIRVR